MQFLSCTAPYTRDIQMHLIYQSLLPGKRNIDFTGLFYTNWIQTLRYGYICMVRNRTNLDSLSEEHSSAFWPGCAVSLCATPSGPPLNILLRIDGLHEYSGNFAHWIACWITRRLAPSLKVRCTHILLAASFFVSSHNRPSNKKQIVWHSF